jgi:NADPH2:quinone reductase
MKAAYINQTGPAENIVYGDLPKPQPSLTQVLVKVSAVAVNPIDTYVRGGAPPAPQKFPFIVGCDLAGVVESVGTEVKQFKPGDRVFGSNQGVLGRQGTFAEYAGVDECWLYRIPDGVADEQAAAVALVSITAGIGLLRDAKLASGETLFINGGSGGVGSMVVQMAKAIGAKVITTAGSDAKVKKCLELGADTAINYKTQDVAAEIKRAAPNGLNVHWETLRDVDFDKAIGLMTPRGRMIVMAGRDARPVFPVGPFYLKSLSLYGFTIFGAPPEEQRACMEKILPWLAAGKIKACVDRVLPLAKTAEAHKLQEESTIGNSGALAGKIVLKP